VYGATGFTGKLVAEHLASKSQEYGIAFAIAGRSKNSLQKVADYLALLNPYYQANPVPLIIAQADDESSLQNMVQQTKVIISTVGPYTLYGQKLVAACVKHQTDYVDLTGEPNFIRELVDKHHEEALKNKTLIVPSCGFDSLPSDLGAFILANEFAARGYTLDNIRASVTKIVGGVSGGTVASGIAIASTVSYRDQTNMAMNPDYLNPGREQVERPWKGALMYYDKDLGLWQTPFVMEITNLKYVRRSNHLLGYSNNFQYCEGLRSRNVVTAAVSTAAIATGGAMMLFPPARWVLNKLLPPGTGPDEETRKNGSFRLNFVGEGKDAQGNRVILKAVVKGDSDPGYLGTSRMIAESAACLALDRASFTKDPQRQFKAFEGGVVTAASSMGFHLIKRLAKVGITIELE